MLLLATVAVTLAVLARRASRRGLYPITMRTPWRAAPQWMTNLYFPALTLAGLFRWAYTIAFQIVGWALFLSVWVAARAAVAVWNVIVLPIVVCNRQRIRVWRTARRPDDGTAAGIPGELARALPAGAVAHHAIQAGASHTRPAAPPAVYPHQLPANTIPARPAPAAAHSLPIGRNDQGHEVVAVLTPAGDTAFVPFIEAEDYV
jgi:hypothetical protein